jgi:hypothetical protein
LSIPNAGLLGRPYVSRERISQIMMLNWLAPEIQQEVLELPKSPGVRFPVSETALREVAKVVGWEEQRGRWEGLAEVPIG